ncbi:MAG: hypothetical protein CW338_00010 [Clostridiales bacterium]|nr:hypothetical protein [Clostridiales bacterium]
MISASQKYDMEVYPMKLRNITAVILSVFLVLSAFLPAAFAEGGSWGQINQDLGRGEDWRQIVDPETTAFRLGTAAPWAEDESVSIMDYGTYPSIDGSTVCVPLAMELARQHLGLPEEDPTGFVSFSTTPYAYERLIYGKPNPMSTLLSMNAVMDPAHPVDLILVTEPSDEELEMAAQEGCDLRYVPFCYDAFVFVDNTQNPVTGLTSAQIRSIYIGEIIDWGEVGGTPGSTILAYQRPKNSGSQTQMENTVMQGIRPVAAQQNYISDGMADLVQQIGNYSNAVDALGYTFLYYITSLYTNDSIRVLSVDGVAPTEENMRSGAYPYTVSYWAVYRKGDANTEAFVNWLVSDEGQEVVKAAGYVTLR